MDYKKAAIITGGGGFFAIQHATAIHQLGMRIILIDIDKKKLLNNKIILKKKKIDVEIYKVNICKEQELILLYKKLNIKKYHVRVLINNACINHIPKKTKVNFSNLNLKNWKLEIDVSLTGTMLCCRVFGNMMRRNRGGIILNIASDLSVIAPDQRIYSHMNYEKPITYSVVKHGVLGITKYLAAYWAKNEVRVNSLSPGGIENQQNKIFQRKIKKLIPMGRMAKQDEYIGTIKYLCSDQSSYMTGQNIIIDGGRSIV